MHDTSKLDSIPVVCGYPPNKDYARGMSSRAGVLRLAKPPHKPYADR